MTIGGSRDPTVPRETPAQNIPDLACSEQGPNPEGYGRETPRTLFRMLI